MGFNSGFKGLTAVNFQFCEVSESVGCRKTGLDVLVGHVGLSLLVSRCGPACLFCFVRFVAFGTGTQITVSCF